MQNKRTINLIILIVFAGSVISCTHQPEAAADSDVLLEADRDFSELAEQVGMNEAFYTFAAEDAVVLRDGSLPLRGRESLKEKYWSRPDTAFTLTWEPVFADIASSGEIGYTYGLYTLILNDTTPPARGTYVTIWKKDAEGNWKFVLDTGTEGIE